MKCLIVITGFILLGILNPVRTTNHDTPKSTQRISIKDAALHEKVATAPPKKPISPPASTATAPAVTPVVASPVPTPSPDPEPNPTPRPTYPAGCALYESLVQQYDWPVATMMAIMQAESSCNPYAVSPTNDYGLMQIHNGLALYGSQIYDPAFNIGIAYQKYEIQGLDAWSTYTSGAYLIYE
jgi:soluble lytic murein transglycosylase-like protein